jgi:hypothetical protein
MMITPKRRKAEVNKAVRRKGLRTLAARYLNAACIVALMVSMIPANLVLPLAAAESVSGQEEAYVAPSASATVIPEASETPATELPEETAQATETPTQEPTAAAEATATAEPAEEPTDEPTQEVTATPTAAPSSRPWR